MHRHSAKCIALAQVQYTKICSADTNRIPQHGLEYRLQFARRRTDDAQHLGARRLLLACLAKFARLTLKLLLQFGNGRTSTTLADLLTPRLVANPFLAVRALLRWWPSDEFEDGLAYGGQCWLRRRPVDSFFPALPF